MSLNDLNKQARTTGVPPQAAQAAQQQQFQQEPPSQPGGRWSFHGASRLNSPVSRGIGSEYLVKLTKAIGEKLKEVDKGIEISLIPMDNSQDRSLYYSLLVLCVSYKNSPKRAMACHTLIIEATGEKPQAIVQSQQFNGATQHIEVMRTASWMWSYNNDNSARVKAKIAQHYPGVEILDADAAVVPRKFNPEDPWSIEALVQNAGLACSNELDRIQPDWFDLDLSSFSNDSYLVTDIAFGRPDTLDAVGNNVRSDVTVAFKSMKNANQQQTQALGGQSNEVTISEVNGFLNIVWTDQDNQSFYVNPYQQTPPPTQKFGVEFVITDIKSNFAMTPANVLLAIVNSSIGLSMDNNWIQGLRPTTREGDQTHDIGGLNIEGKLDKLATNYAEYRNYEVFSPKADTSLDTFNLEALGRFVSALIQPGMSVAIDIPDCGPQSWYLRPFADALNASDSAYSLLYNAAQTLTGNNFGKHFQYGHPIFNGGIQRIHMGWYEDRAGHIKDLRHIDYLAVCNLVGERNPMAIREWSDTFLRTDFNQSLRLQARKKMIGSLTGETAEYHEFGTRGTLSADFLLALTRGIAETAVRTKVNTPLSNSEFISRRGVATTAGAVILPQFNPAMTFVSRDVGVQAGQVIMPGYHRVY